MCVCCDLWSCLHSPSHLSFLFDWPGNTNSRNAQHVPYFAGISFGPAMADRAAVNRPIPYHSCLWAVTNFAAIDGGSHTKSLNSIKSIVGTKSMLSIFHCMHAAAASTQCIGKQAHTESFFRAAQKLHRISECNCRCTVTLYTNMQHTIRRLMQQQTFVDGLI